MKFSNSFSLILLLHILSYKWKLIKLSIYSNYQKREFNKSEEEKQYSKQINLKVLHLPKNLLILNQII
jgi:uncharacterized membrane protein